MKRRTSPVPDEVVTGSGSRADPSILTSIVLTAAFVVTLLAVWLPGGSVGNSVRSFLSQAFGWGIYVAPVVLGAYTTAALRTVLDRSYRLPWPQAAGWLLALWAIVTALQPLGTSDASTGGGWVGRLTWGNLSRAFGVSATSVLVLVVAIYAVGLLLGLSVHDLRTLGMRIIRAAVARARRLINPSLAGSRQGPASASFPSREGYRPPSHPSGTTNGPAWRLPPLAMLNSGRIGALSQSDIDHKIQLIERTLADFDVYAKVVQVSPGPTITQFGLEPGFRERVDRNGAVVRREKIRVSEILTLQNDLALALAAQSIRIEAPVPGQQVVGLEVPNNQSTLVSLRDVVEGSAFQKLRQKTKLAIALGEDVTGQPVASDLAKMPHLLIAGATGSGKSICINAIISCLLLQATPEEVRLILIDPKRVELTSYNDDPHLLRPVVVDVDKVVDVLRWVVKEMDDRYRLFEKLSVRNIEGYNKIVNGQSASQPGPAAEPNGTSNEQNGLKTLPFIVVVIDELADMMMLAPDETERLICRLAQLSRATGIHLIVATQRPSVDVITGLIKANFPTRISFAVTSQIDSRTILDTPGAEKLLGRGDMLFLPTDVAKPIRIQGVFVSDEEIAHLTGHWRAIGPAQYVEALLKPPNLDDPDEAAVDELYPKAVEIAKEVSRVSINLLQRRLHIGHGRAANLVTLLEKNGDLPALNTLTSPRETLHDSPA